MGIGRFRLLVVLGAVLSLVLAACGGGEEEAAPQPTAPPAATSAPAATTAPAAQPTATPRPTAAPAPTATAAPVSSGQLTVTLGFMGTFALLPFPLATNAHDSYAFALYDFIITASPDLNPDPKKLDFARGFATSVTSNADGSVWTLKGRKGVVFHNGDAATAKDAAYTTGLLLTKENLNTLGFDLQKLVTKVESPDDETVVYTLNRTAIFFPSSYLSAVTSSLTVHLLPQKYVESVGFAEGNKKPVGSGPYKLKSVTVGDRVVVEAVDKHWYYGVPRTKTITYALIPEESTRLALLKTGVSDLADISEGQIASAKAANLRTYVDTGSGRWVTLLPPGFNKPLADGSPNPLSKEDVRKALAWYAVDKQVLLKSFFPNTGLVLEFPISQLDTSYDPSIKVPGYDPAKARSLLEQAGYPKGFEVDVWITDGGSVPPLELYEAVFVYWEKIGMKVNRIGPFPQATLGARAQAAVADSSWKKPTIYAQGAFEALIAADVHVPLAHNPAGRYFVTDEPQAVRLAAAFQASKSIDDYIKNGRAYQTYVAEHVLSWWSMVGTSSAWAASSKFPQDWRAQNKHIGAFAAQR